MIYVLGSVFHCLQELPIVRVSTLINQIDSTVRVQAYNMGIQNAAGKDDVKLSFNQDPKSKVTRSHYAIGVSLVEFLVDRKLITLKTEESYSCRHNPINTTFK